MYYEGVEGPAQNPTCGRVLHFNKHVTRVTVNINFSKMSKHFLLNRLKLQHTLMHKRCVVLILKQL